MMDINGSGRIRFGVFEVDLHTRELWKHGIRLKLVGQPFDILAVLLKRPGQLVTREELRSQLWPSDTFVDFNHGLNAAVNKLRDALCDSADNPKYIETLPRRGYRFIAAVESEQPDITESATSSSSVEAMSQAPASEQEESGTTPTSRGDGSASFPALETIATRLGGKPLWRRLIPIALAFVVLWLVVDFGILDWLRSSTAEQGAKESAEQRARNARQSATSGALNPLTPLSDSTDDPAFSPDGSRVAFRRKSFVPGDSGIWVQHLGGEELIQLTNDSSDCCPVWSPDGGSLAFSRLTEQRTIYEIPASGGEVGKVYSGGLVPDHAEMDWSPDGRSMAFVEKGRQSISAIFLLSRDGGSARQITTPTEAGGDWGPRFSPDGNQIAFVRAGGILVMPAEGGETRHLTKESVKVIGSPAWTADGQTILFAGTEFGEHVTALWRISLSGDEPTLLREAGARVRDPIIARRGFRLACVAMSSARSIDQMDLYPSGQKPRTLVTSMSGENAGQQLSPDNTKIAFQSDRAGGMDIWVSDRNGQNPIQLTAMGTAGAPQWSPDGKEIAFDVGLGPDWQQPRAVFLVNADGGSPRPLVQDSFSNPRPTWSHDGQWIYFASDRSGDWQIWKVARSGGAPLQVTKQGGFAAQESPDGKYLYYAKNRYDFPEIWRVPVAGGSETPIFPGIRPFDWAAWTLVDSGIVFATEGANDVPTVGLYDFSTHGVKYLAVLDRRPFWVTATRDGKSLIFDQPGQEASHVMLLENFR